MKNNKRKFDQSVYSFAGEPKAILSLKEEELKSVLVKRLSAQYADVGERLVYLSVNEAGALASLTFAPLLVLPSLAEEKVQQAAAWAAHQRAVLGEDHVAFAA